MIHVDSFGDDGMFKSQVDLGGMMQTCTIVPPEIINQRTAQ
jgi:hypothetical protein